MDISARMPVVIEVLEPRLQLNGFTGNMTALPTGVANTAYTGLELDVTGDTAHSVTIDWGDTNSNLYTPTGGIGTGGYVPPGGHTYTSPGSYPITAKFQSTHGGVIATAPFALDKDFGTFNYQTSGRTVTRPAGSSTTVNEDGVAMAVDPSTEDIYVLSQYNAKQFAVTRFLAPTSSQVGGILDTSWGQTANPGTLVLDPFVSSSYTDVPTAMSIGKLVGGDVAIAVAGYTNNGWCVALIDASAQDLQFQYGVVEWHKNHGDGLPANRANAVYMDNTDADVLTAGTDGTNLVITEQMSSDGSLDTFFNTTGIVSLAPPSGATSMTANAITEVDDVATTGHLDELLIGGSTLWPSGESDYTLAEMADDGTMNTSFNSTGIVRTNFGNVISQSCCNVCNHPSSDSCYSLVPWDNDGTWEFYALGSSTAFNTLGERALALYNASTGALITSFGPYGDGLDRIQGGGGAIYSGVLYDSTSGKILTGGINGNGDGDVLMVNALGNLVGGAGGFGTSGEFTTDLGTSTGNSTDVFRSIALEPSDSSIVLGGYTFTNSSNGQIALADYWATNEVTIARGGGSPLAPSAAMAWGAADTLLPSSTTGSDTPSSQNQKDLNAALLDGSS